MIPKMDVSVSRVLQQARRYEEKHAGIRTAAIRSAMGRASQAARTAGVRAVSRNVGVKRKAILGRIGKSRIQMKNGELRVTLWFRHVLLPPEAFADPHETKTGVKAGSHLFNDAFLASKSYGRSAGSVGVFKRRGRERGPIVRQGVDLVRWRDLWVDASRTSFNEVFPRRLKHELDRRLKAGGLK